MYDEMLKLIKNDLDTPAQDEEDKKEESNSDNEGFNDDRDEDWNDMKSRDKSPKDKTNDRQKREARKKRFDETLNTIKEESEPESTFQNTK
jgi:hypothetical protein